MDDDGLGSVDAGLARQLRKAAPSRMESFPFFEPTRYWMLRSLCDDGFMTVSELSERIGRAPAATSQHLRILREAGLVAASAYGTQRLYYLPASKADAVRALVEVVVRLTGVDGMPAGGGL